MTPRAGLNAGLLVGALAGLWDGIGTLVQNPRSFHGPLDSVAFLGLALALSLGIGAAAGALAGASRRRALERWAIPVGIALWVFLWAGIQAHVRFLFGEPLLSAKSLAVYGGIALAAGALGAGLGTIGGRGLASLTKRTAFLPVSLALFGISLGLATLASPGETTPVTSTPPSESGRDLLLVTLDTTRADHLSCYGYPRATTPALDRLARRGVTHLGYRAPIPLTNPSHSSLFSGKLPREHGVLNNGTALPESVRTFVEDLADEGWNCAAFVSAIPLKAGLSGLAKGFAVYDDTFSPLERVHPMLTALAVVRAANRILPIDFIERRADGTVVAAIEWLRESTGPRFLWVHLFDPHTPYEAPRPWRERFGKDSPAWSAHGKPVTGWPVADYDAELARTDRELERLIRAFEEVTGGDGAVVVTADHGEGLEQHGELTHGALLYEEDLLVPVIVKHPGLREDQPNVFGDGLGSTTSLTRNLRRIPQGDPARILPRSDPVVSETFAPEGRENKSAVTGWLDETRLGKIVVNWETGEELAFRLDRDPGETEPVAAKGPAWDELRGRLPVPGPSESDELDPETVRRLRALGYVH